MRKLVDVHAKANPNTDLHTIILQLWASPEGERDFVLSPTQAEVLVLALTDALEQVDERT